jgi:hypothetical protein
MMILIGIIEGGKLWQIRTHKKCISTNNWKPLPGDYSLS